MDIDVANTLFNNGSLMALYKAGFVTEKLFVYREIYLWVQAQLKTRNLTKSQAVLEAEIKFNKDKRTVWRALNCFTLSNNDLANSFPSENIMPYSI